MNTFFSSEMPAHTLWPTRAPTTEVSLSRRPYLPQTVRREQKERKHWRRERKEGRAGGREGRRVKNSHGSESHRTVGGVRVAGSHSQSHTHSWRTHLDLESQS